MDNTKRNNVKSVRFSDEEIFLINEKAKEADRKIADYIRIATLRYIEMQEKSRK